MLINLFSDDSITRKADRRFSYNMNCESSIDENRDKNYVLMSALNTRDDVFISSVKYALNNRRSINFILGACIDSHFNLESMNVSKRSRGYVVVYSINNLLPIVLNMLCGCDIEKVANIKFINEISDSILNLNLDRTLYVNSLVHSDPNLDEYLKKYFGKDDYDVEYLKSFVSDINSKALYVLKYIMSHLETHSSLIFLSIDRSRILLSSDDDNPPVLEIEFNGVKYRLNPYVTDELNAFHRDCGNFNFCEVVA